MKYIAEFRDGDGARHIAENIKLEARVDKSYHFMEFCGGHTHAISRYGIADLLPPNVRMIHGPGCPVCVLPIGRIDLAIRLALDRGVMICTYGDTMRVPASDSLSLIKAKARGADIRMVYSAHDALKLAEQHRTVRWCSWPSVLRPPRRPRRWCCVMRQRARWATSASCAAMCSRRRPSRTFWNRPKCARWARCRLTALLARRM